DDSRCGGCSVDLRVDISLVKDIPATADYRSVPEREACTRSSLWLEQVSNGVEGTDFDARKSGKPLVQGKAGPPVGVRSRGQGLRLGKQSNFGNVLLERHGKLERCCVVRDVVRPRRGISEQKVTPRRTEDTESVNHPTRSHLGESDSLTERNELSKTDI